MNTTLIIANPITGISILPNTYKPKNDEVITANFDRFIFYLEHKEKPITLFRASDSEMVLLDKWYGIKK